MSHISALVSCSVLLIPHNPQYSILMSTPENKLEEDQITFLLV